jgi:hypothetical protein
MLKIHRATAQTVFLVPGMCALLLCSVPSINWTTVNRPVGKDGDGNDCDLGTVPAFLLRD